MCATRHGCGYYRELLLGYQFHPPRHRADQSEIRTERAVNHTVGQGSRAPSVQKAGHTASRSKYISEIRFPRFNIHTTAPWCSIQVQEEQTAIPILVAFYPDTIVAGQASKYLSRSLSTHLFLVSPILTHDVLSPFITTVLLSSTNARPSENAVSRST